MLTGVLLFGEDIDMTKSQMPAVNLRHMDVVTSLEMRIKHSTKRWIVFLYK